MTCKRRSPLTPFGNILPLQRGQPSDQVLSKPPAKRKGAANAAEEPPRKKMKLFRPTTAASLAQKASKVLRPSIPRTSVGCQTKPHWLPRVPQPLQVTFPVPWGVAAAKGVAHAASQTTRYFRGATMVSDVTQTGSSSVSAFDRLLQGRDVSQMPLPPDPSKDPPCDDDEEDPTDEDAAEGSASEGAWVVSKGVASRTVSTNTTSLQVPVLPRAAPLARRRRAWMMAARTWCRPRRRRHHQSTQTEAPTEDLD